MTNPESYKNIRRDGDSNDADELVWIALGIDDGDFESAVRNTLSRGGIVTLATAAARLQIMSDHDMRHIDVISSSKYLDEPTDMLEVIERYTTKFIGDEQTTYEAIARSERHDLNQEQDVADFHLPY